MSGWERLQDFLHRSQKCTSFHFACAHEVVMEMKIVIDQPDSVLEAASFPNSWYILHLYGR